MRQLLSDIALIPDANLRGETFERVVKWLLENTPEFRDQFKKVWLWEEYPDAKGADLGIDLVAETRPGDPLRHPGEVLRGRPESDLARLEHVLRGRPGP